MNLTLIGIMIGACVVLILIRGLGVCFARNAARTQYRNAINAELRRRATPVRVVGILYVAFA